MQKFEETMLNDHMASLLKTKYSKEASWHSHKEFPRGMKDELKQKQKSNTEGFCYAQY